MADISELVVRLRALAARFRGLVNYPGKYAFTHCMTLRDDGDEILDAVWKLGFLRSIPGVELYAKFGEIYVEELGCCLDASLFANVVGFDLFAMKAGRSAFDPGLLHQASVAIPPQRIKNLFTLELMKRYSDEMREQIEKPDCELSDLSFWSLVDDAEWRDALDFFGFEIFERNARGCEMLIEVIEREVAAHKPIQQADDGDGLFEENRILIWGGVRFELTTNQALIFALLVDAYPGSVVNNTFEDKGIANLRDSFRFNDPSGKKQYKPCWNLIEVGAVKDSKRLVDPSIVRADPEKFSSPQHNPQRSPG